MYSCFGKQVFYQIYRVPFRIFISAGCGKYTYLIFHILPLISSYAPWCPACKALEEIWESLAFQKKELGINVGKVDVTDAPGLSGRFMVTALPTIYQSVSIFRIFKNFIV